MMTSVITTSFGTIRTTADDPPLYCAYDVAVCLGHKDPSSFVRLCKSLGTTMLKVPTKFGIHSAVFIDRAGLTAMLTRSTMTNVVKLSEELGISITPIHIIRKETSTIMDIVMCFHPQFKMTRQYSIGKYRVDLYIHDLNVVVECDENDHSTYNKAKDEDRTAFINTCIAPEWVRYNPDGGLHVPINAIVRRIVRKLAP